jgi:hypothetical protein
MAEYATLMVVVSVAALLVMNKVVLPIMEGVQGVLSFGL